MEKHGDEQQRQRRPAERKSFPINMEAVAARHRDDENSDRRDEHREIAEAAVTSQRDCSASADREPVSNSDERRDAAGHVFSAPRPGRLPEYGTLGNFFFVPEQLAGIESVDFVIVAGFVCAEGARTKLGIELA